jgi:KipI family sensor histidine kinase inhibitor
MTTPRIEPLGDAGLLVRLGERIHAATNDAAHALAERLRAAALPGVVDIVPAYASVALRYDIAIAHRAGDQALPHEHLLDAVRRIVAMPTPAPAASPADDGDCLDIPVCYGGEFGADLEAVAAHCGLTPAEVAARHATPVYRVAMLGFMPGFAYLLGLDDALHAPRRATPRTRVPAGSVAIGGAQTGVYPRELPGGWNLIGRTPLALFDARREPAALLRAGQRVRFRAIDAREFVGLPR